MSDAQTYAGGPRVRHGFFVAFFFESETVRVWNGFRNIHLGGFDWAPVGPAATVSQIEDPISDSVPQLMLSVSGVSSDLLALALSEADQVRGRLVFIYDQYFDVDWQPVGTFENYAVARMDNIKVSRQHNGDGWDRVIQIPSEFLLVNGPNPVAGRYTAADQQIRFPGQTDNYFDFISALQNKLIRWPTF